ncbi:EthD domain-containing protein [Hymenobacter sp.]|jgi:hypothetical protein|uniref:EthD domain-containing protein n=1 Tax=Hymenobacter sp. TaxID=1898978 RepID=UPI002ED96CE0
MIKQMIAVRRRPGLTHQECLDYVEHTHGTIARGGPNGLLRYVQSHVFDSAFGAKADGGYQQVFGRDFVTELFFESPETMKANAESEYVRTVVRPDERNFNDFANVILDLMTETELSVPQPGPAEIKVIHYLKKADGLSAEIFEQQWVAAHEAIMGELPTVAAALRRYVQARPLRMGGQGPVHGNSVMANTYGGIASLWFEQEVDLKEFRAYEQALLRQTGPEGQPLIDSERSFFLYTRERVIIG